MEKGSQKKEKSFLGKIKSQLIVDDEDTSSEESEGRTSGVGVQTSTQTLPQAPSFLDTSRVTPQSYTSNGSQPERVKEMRDMLEKSLENTSALFDYPKYRKALSQLKTIIPDEVVRFKTAFVTAQTLNVKKTDVVQSATGCLAILTDEKNKFDSELKDAYTHNVEALEKQCSEIDSQVASKIEQCKKLTDEIAALNTQKTEVQTNIINSKKEIESASMYFAAAHNELTTEIQADINKMSTYLEA